MKRHYRQSRYEQGLLYCALQPFIETPRDHPFEHDHERRFLAASVWYDGGAKNGCYQPFTVVEDYESDEIDIRTFIERRYPGIEYRALPII